jgi:enhancing lycopene biosynthesis protein 2
MVLVRTRVHQSPGGYRGENPVRSVAFVLAGCGARDGTEITEAVTAMVALSQAGYAVSFFAPQRATHHVVNHATGEVEVGASRSMLQESCRIARGQVAPLSDLRPAEFDALVFSGGFGVAKNLCDFAFKGASASLESDVRDTIFAFWSAQKPVGAMCIAPILLSLAAREKGVRGVRITLGPGTATETISAASAMGCEVVNCGSGESCIDTRHRFVSVPAYMVDNASPADIFACAKALVKGLETLLGAV